MNLANNHAFDYGPSGRRRRSPPSASSGSRTPAGRARSPTSRSATIEVAVVGFAPYPWAQSLTNIPAARRLVTKAAAHADVVVVTMHAGAEGADQQHVRPGHRDVPRREPRQLVAFSHAVVDAGADLVIGSGPHVLRGMEWYRGRLIAYSLGNFAGYRVFALGGPLSIERQSCGSRLRGDGALRQRRCSCRRGSSAPGCPRSIRPRARTAIVRDAVAGRLRRTRCEGLADR